MQLEKLKNIIQSSNVNFLLGSGLSKPYLATLANIENWLTECQSVTDEKTRNLIEDALKIEYVESVMKPCLYRPQEKNGENVKEDEEAKKAKDLRETEIAYQKFLSIWNYIISHRGSGLWGKQINLFTTNIDPFVEEAAERLGLEFNNGFKGVLNPVFREESFNAIVAKLSPLYQKSSEIPTFNYLKIHGSINWKTGDNQGKILYDRGLSVLENVVRCIREYPCEYQIMKRAREAVEGVLKGNTRKVTLKDLKDAAEFCLREEKSPCKENEKKMQSFRDAYDKLVMIHPRKTKFRETVLDLHFYELMRLYANALERASTCLFVAGFSFADEHIAQITLRAAVANPTLLILVFAYDADERGRISSRLGTSHNNNIVVLSPQEFWDSQGQEFRESMKEQGSCERFDLNSINKYVFESIKKLID